MPKIYTPNDLIRYIYKETDPLETSEIAEGAVTHPKAAEDLENFQMVADSLNGIDLKPDPTSVSIILEYSMKLHEPAH